MEVLVEIHYLEIIPYSEYNLTGFRLLEQKDPEDVVSDEARVSINGSAC